MRHYTSTSGFSTTPGRHLIELDDYEVCNLKRLLYAVAGLTGEGDDPLKGFNNGDWVGQIAWYLPEPSTLTQNPNRAWPEGTRPT